MENEDKKNVEVEEKENKAVAPKRDYDLGYVHPFWSMVNDFFDDGMSEDVMRTDISDEGKDYRIEVEVPGIDKKDIHLSLNRGYLTVNAKTNRSNHEDSGKFVHTERCYGKFSRSFYVGNAVTKKDISATCNNGLLTVIINKPTAKAQESNDIEIA